MGFVVMYQHYVTFFDLLLVVAGGLVEFSQ